MIIDIQPLLRGLTDGNVVLGALIGAETLYLLMRLPVQHLLVFSGLFAGALLSVAGIDFGVGRLPIAPVYHALLFAGISAVFSWVVLRLMRILGRAHFSSDVNIVLGASLASVMIVLPYRSGIDVTSAVSLFSGAIELWLGFAALIAVVHCTPHRLRHQFLQLGVRSVPAFYVTMALIALVAAGFTFK